VAVATGVSVEASVAVAVADPVGNGDDVLVGVAA